MTIRSGQLLKVPAGGMSQLVGCP